MAINAVMLWGRCHGGRRPSSNDTFHSPTVIPPSALDKPSITKRSLRRRTCSHTSPRRSPTKVTLHDTRFVECRWWNDGWTAKSVDIGRSLASMMPAPDLSTFRKSLKRLSISTMPSCIPVVMSAELASFYQGSRSTVVFAAEDCAWLRAS